LSGVALVSTASTTHVTNAGLVEGEVRFSHEAPGIIQKFMNEETGTYRSAGSGTIDLGHGNFWNAGSFDIGGVGDISTANLFGSLDAWNTSSLLVDVTSTAEEGQLRSDLLDVSGTVRLDGDIHVNVVGGLRPETFTVL